MRFSNYYNHEGGNRNIYSRRNLLGMTMKEILERELELAYQYNTIGIPDDDELMNSQNAYQYDDNGVQRWSSGQKTPEQMLAEQQKRIQESQAQNLADQNALNAMNTYTNNNLQGFDEPIQNALPKPIANQNLNTDSNYLVKNITDGIKTFNNLNMKNFSNKNLDDSKKSTGGIVAETPEEIEESIVPKVNTKLELTEAEKEEARLKAFEDALDRHYNLDKNGKPLPTGNEEPYLSYEELLGLEPLDTEIDKTQDLYNTSETNDKGLPTGAAANINYISNNNTKKTKFLENLDKNGKIYYTDEQGRNVNPNLVEKVKYDLEDFKENVKSKIFEHAEQDFDPKSPMTLEEKALQTIIEHPGKIIFPLASGATTNALHDMAAARKAKDVKVYEDLDSFEDPKLKGILKRIGAKSEDKGAIYGYNTKESKEFSNSPEMDKYLKSIKNDILSGKPLKDTSFLYDAVDKDAFKDPKRYDRYAFARKITVANPKVDKDGYFTCDLVDYSDFKDEKVDSIGTYLNKWGYKMQEKGKYKPHYQIVKIRRKIR